MMELTRIRPAVARYAVAAGPTASGLKGKKVASSAHSRPLSVGLPIEQETQQQNHQSSHEGQHGQRRHAASRASVRENGVQKSRAASWSPGRQIIATKTDSKNKTASWGTMAGKTEPRSRNTEKAMKFKGSRKATASRAMRPGPAEGSAAGRKKIQRRAEPETE